MAGSTMVFGAPTRRAEMWRVYRIRTANSTYELEVQSEGTARRCTVLTRVDPAGESFEDSAPQLDGKSLYAESPLDWIGKQLAVGTARTSEIQSVDFLTTASERRASRTSIAVAAPPAPAQERRPDWAPFPLGFVEMTEAAAAVLSNVAHRHDLSAAIRNDPHLVRRLELALAQCGLMVETLTRRGR